VSALVEVLSPQAGTARAPRHRHFEKGTQGTTSRSSKGQARLPGVRRGSRGHEALDKNILVLYTKLQKKDGLKVAKKRKGKSGVPPVRLYLHPHRRSACGPLQWVSIQTRRANEPREPEALAQLLATRHRWVDGMFDVLKQYGLPERNIYDDLDADVSAMLERTNGATGGAGAGMEIGREDGGRQRRGARGIGSDGRFCAWFFFLLIPGHYPLSLGQGGNLHSADSFHERPMLASQRPEVTASESRSRLTSLCSTRLFHGKHYRENIAVFHCTPGLIRVFIATCRHFSRVVAVRKRPICDLHLPFAPDSSTQIVPSIYLSILERNL
jgi:hypothetical protein